MLKRLRMLLVILSPHLYMVRILIVYLLMLYLILLVNILSTDNDVSNTDDVEVKEFISSDKQETQQEKCKTFSYHNTTCTYLIFNTCS